MVNKIDTGVQGFRVLVLCVKAMALYMLPSRVPPSSRQLKQSAKSEVDKSPAPDS